MSRSKEAIQQDLDHVYRRYSTVPESDTQALDELDLEVEKLLTELDETSMSSPIQSRQQSQTPPPPMQPGIRKDSRLGINILIIVLVLAGSYFAVPSIRQSVNNAFTSASSESDFDTSTDRSAPPEEGSETATYQQVEQKSAELEAVASSIAPNDLLHFRTALANCTSEDGTEVYCSEDVVVADVRTKRTDTNGIVLLEELEQIMERSNGWQVRQIDILDNRYQKIERANIRPEDNYNIRAVYEYQKNGKRYCFVMSYFKEISPTRFDLSWRGSIDYCLEEDTL